jgi:short subunit dehydrogenase-like uncharacterized protein
MSRLHEVLNLIEIIRDSFPNSIEVYTKGSCVQFALILNTVYPKGEIYYNVDHAVFELDNHYFDITGEITIDKYYKKLSEYGIPHINQILKLRYEK